MLSRERRQLLDRHVDRVDKAVLEVVQDFAHCGHAENAVTAFADAPVLSVTLPRLLDDVFFLARAECNFMVVENVVRATLAVAPADIVSSLDFVILVFLHNVVFEVFHVNLDRHLLLPGIIASLFGVLSGRLLARGVLEVSGIFGWYWRSGL